jgi:hypothetical protein
MVPSELTRAKLSEVRVYVQRTSSQRLVDVTGLLACQAQFSVECCLSSGYVQSVTPILVGQLARNDSLLLTRRHIQILHMAGKGVIDRQIVVTYA